MEANHCQSQSFTELPLCLASSSQYRQALLSRLHLTFEVDVPAIDETPYSNESPKALVARLAEHKALAVAARSDVPKLVIGSDQVAVLEGAILGKPGTYEKNVEQLKNASGRPVHFLTGLCLLNTSNDRAQIDVIEYQVKFRTLSVPQIEHYVSLEKPYDCAGGFKSEGLGVALFESMNGEDPSSLIGLPLIRLTQMLLEEGLDVLHCRRTAC